MTTLCLIKCVIGYSIYGCSMFDKMSQWLQRLSLPCVSLIDSMVVVIMDAMCLLECPNGCSLHACKIFAKMSQ